MGDKKIDKETLGKLRQALKEAGIASEKQHQIYSKLRDLRLAASMKVWEKKGGLEGALGAGKQLRGDLFKELPKSPRDVQSSRELVDNINEAVEAIKQNLWYDDTSDPFVDENIKWLEELLKLAHVELGH